MQIDRSTVEKITITKAERAPGCGTLDPIAVIVEDFGPGQGKITITCFGEAWSHYWSHMGETNKLMPFFVRASDNYLVCKLKTGIRDTVDDEDSDALETLLQKKIIKGRLEGKWSKREARDLWDEATYIMWDDRADICYKVLGDEWWYLTPKKPNPDYLYLRDIVRVIKEAFKTML